MGVFMQKEKKESGFFSIITKMNANVTPAVIPARGHQKVVTKEVSTTKTGVFEVDIALLLANPHQPRKAFCQAALDELAASIKEHGILQPILVYKKLDKYIIIAGERRFRAAQSLGMTKIPIILKEATEKQQKEWALIENLHREDLNAIEEAEAIYSLIAEYSLTQEEVAKVLGKSRPAVTNTLRLLKLNPSIKNLIREGALTAGHGRVLLSLKEESEQIKLAKDAALKKLSVHELERAINKKLMSSIKGKRTNAFPKCIRELKALERDMQKIFATKVTISGDADKGKILINYFSQEELQRIFDILEEIRLD